MEQIARWTTPSFFFKPKAVAVGAVDQIYLVIKQSGTVVISKSLADATVTDKFTWTLTQADTGGLSTEMPAIAKIDYLSNGIRYTTAAKQYEVVNSAKNGVIT